MFGTVQMTPSRGQCSTCFEKNSRWTQSPSCGAHIRVSLVARGRTACWSVASMDTTGGGGGAFPFAVGSVVQGWALSLVSPPSARLTTRTCARGGCRRPRCHLHRDAGWHSSTVLTEATPRGGGAGLSPARPPLATGSLCGRGPWRAARASTASVHVLEGGAAGKQRRGGGATTDSCRPALAPCLPCPTGTGRGSPSACV